MEDRITDDSPLLPSCKRLEWHSSLPSPSKSSICNDTSMKMLEYLTATKFKCIE